MNQLIKTYRIPVFALGILLFLARPFMGYAVTYSDMRLGNTGTTFSLQRLVKKKEEHLETESLATEIILTEVVLKPVFRLVRLFYDRFGLILGFKTLSATGVITCLNQIMPDNHRFRLCSVYKI